jgi:hypothetical protein
MSSVLIGAPTDALASGARSHVFQALAAVFECSAQAEI